MEQASAAGSSISSIASSKRTTPTRAKSISSRWSYSVAASEHSTGCRHRILSMLCLSAIRAETASANHNLRGHHDGDKQRGHRSNQRKDRKQLKSRWKQTCEDMDCPHWRESLIWSVPTAASLISRPAEKHPMAIMSRICPILKRPVTAFSTEKRQEKKNQQFS